MTDPVDSAEALPNGALEAGGRVAAEPRDDPAADRARGNGSNGAQAFQGSDRPEGTEGRRSEQSHAPAAARPGERHDILHKNDGKRRRRRRAKRGKNRHPHPAANGAAHPEPRGPRHEAKAEAPHPHHRAPGGGGDGDAAKPAHAPPPKPRHHKHPHPKQGKPRPDHSGAPVYAALDLGTNNCRLLMAVPTRPGRFRVIDAFSRIVRLGEGLGANGRLSDAAMDRAIEALKVCAGKLETKTVRRHRLIATEACRSAANGTEFLDQVKSETGLDLEIVNRETEARLAVSGCSSLVERETAGVLLFDIGGGSSEIAAIDLSGSRSNRLANHISAWTSLPVGVVTLSERHGGRDVTQRIFAAMVEEVADLLEGFLCPDLPGCGPGVDGAFHLLGTSGTVTTLAGVHLDLPRHDRRRVDGLWLTSGEVDRMTQKLLSWDFKARSANPCIGSDRADLVLAGCAILEAIRRRWPSERLRVADRGLREGLLTEMMAADGIWRRGRGRRPHFRRHGKPQGKHEATRHADGPGSRGP